MRTQAYPNKVAMLLDINKIINEKIDINKSAILPRFDYVSDEKHYPCVNIDCFAQNINETFGKTLEGQYCVTGRRGKCILAFKDFSCEKEEPVKDKLDKDTTSKKVVKDKEPKKDKIAKKNTTKRTNKK